MTSKLMLIFYLFMYLIDGVGWEMSTIYALVISQAVI